MASLNPLTRELVFKIVFYGPGLGGKTTTLQFIHATTKPEHRGKMVSLATPTDRTLYFDFLPLRVPRVRGMSVRLQLFTVPGQVYYSATRKLVLSGADGVVFVADSQGGRLDANQESLEDLNANLADHNKVLTQIPHTFQWNKRDLSDLVSIEELDRRFNAHGAPSLGTVGTRGDGVFEGLERITRLVLRHYESELPKHEQQVMGLQSGAGEISIVEAIRGLAEAPLVSKVTPFTGTPAVRVDARGEPLRTEGSRVEVEPATVSAAGLSMAAAAAAASAKAAALTPATPNRANIENASTGSANVSFASQVAASNATSASQNAPSAAPPQSSNAMAKATAVPPAVAPAPAEPAAPSRPAMAVPVAPAPPPAPAPPASAPPEEAPPARETRGAPPMDAPHAEPDRIASDDVGASPAPAGAPTIAPPPGTSHFSVAELWPEGEREAVRQTETLIGARDAHGAVLACDLLLTRVLASAAALAGSVDAPRDPGLVSLLLGLDGRRYLAFRAAVRAARHKEEVSVRDALECFAFLLEARGARDAFQR